MNYIGKIKEINKKYEFKDIDSYTISMSCNSRKKIESVDLHKELFKIVLSEDNLDLQNIYHLNSNANYNIALYNYYLKEYNYYYNLLHLEEKNLKLSFKKLKLKFITVPLIKHYKIKPTTKFNVTMHTNYTSPAKRVNINYKKSYTNKEFFNLYNYYISEKNMHNQSINHNEKNVNLYMHNQSINHNEKNVNLYKQSMTLLEKSNQQMMSIQEAKGAPHPIPIQHNSLIQKQPAIRKNNNYTLSKKNNKIKGQDKIRISVFERDNFKCVFCGKSAKDSITKLDSYYINKNKQPNINVNNFLNVDLSDYITICNSCCQKNINFIPKVRDGNKTTLDISYPYFKQKYLNINNNGEYNFEKKKNDKMKEYAKQVEIINTIKLNGINDPKEIEKIVKNGFKDTQRSILSEKEKKAILERDNFKCQYCGKTKAEDNIKLAVDHIFPVAHGGKSETINLQTLCKQCNSGKRDRIIIPPSHNTYY